MSTRPTYENLPPELVKCSHWCPWLMEPRFPGEEPTKIGYDTRTGRRAKSNDPSTHMQYAVALAAYNARPDKWRGLFFSLYPYVGLDLDDCRDPVTGEIVPRAWRIIQRFSTYSEVSQSRRGVKLILGKLTTMPTEEGAGKNYRKDPWSTGTGGIEFYQRGRFFALTGWHLPSTPTTINEGTSELRKLYRELYPPQPKRIIPDVGNISNVDERTRAQRCDGYVSRMSASISGSGGHGRLLAAACACWRFGLSESSALAILRHFNERCVPPWLDRELERKWTEAAKVSGSATFGSMLADRDQVAPAPVRRVSYFTVGAA
jgi:primase-polymerase (primpol)-like protein